MISTKGRYALRVMLDLAQQPNDTYIPLTEIAQRQDISLKYLEIVIKSLVQKNLLKGVRGKGGGYKLTRKPEEYNVGEILELSEEKMATVACLAKDSSECPRQSMCMTIPMWSEYDKFTQEYFGNITLKDIIDNNLPTITVTRADK